MLLLDHCARYGRLTEAAKPSARARLDAKLGGELARSLLGSLGTVPAPKPPSHLRA